MPGAASPTSERYPKSAPSYEGTVLRRLRNETTRAVRLQVICGRRESKLEKGWGLGALSRTERSDPQCSDAPRASPRGIWVKGRPSKSVPTMAGPTSDNNAVSGFAHYVRSTEARRCAPRRKPLNVIRHDDS